VGPALEHPANAAVVTVLREGATKRPDGTYELRTHPDLGSWLIELGEGLDVRLEHGLDGARGGRRRAQGVPGSGSGGGGCGRP
jgi:hypothetical protein